MFKKSVFGVLIGVFCLGCFIGCANAENTNTLIVTQNNTQEEQIEVLNPRIEEKIELPVGGMPTKRVEIPTVAHDIGDNWDANIDRIAITGGSAITIDFGNVRGGSTSAPEDGFKGSFSGGSDAGFGSGPHGPGAGSDWGAGSFEVASTFDITDGTNYFVSEQEAVIVE